MGGAVELFFEEPKSFCDGLGKDFFDKVGVRSGRRFQNGHIFID